VLKLKYDSPPSNCSFKFNSCRYTEPWASKLDGFQKLLVLRTVRPDKLTSAVQIFGEVIQGTSAHCVIQHDV
jgi:hypothetical protein